MQIDVIDTPELGDRSYIVHEGCTALVIDPQRDVDRFLAAAERLGVRVDLVLDTHIHNDYVSGGPALAAATGARYAVNAEDPVRFERVGVRDGDELTAGDLTVRALATPGHTRTHLSYVVGGTDAPAAAFTGGSLLYGSVGRTDLVDPRCTEELTRLQYRSAHRLARDLPAATTVHPTHGFGSFCSAGAVTVADGSTIGAERVGNDALTGIGEQDFVRQLIARLTAYPAYYAHMAPLNLAGAGPLDRTPPEPVDPAALGVRIAAGEWVIDLRDRAAYAADHVRGTVNIGLGAQFLTYAGWLLPWGRAFTLIGATPEDIAQAQRQLGLIGIERPDGAAAGDLETVAGPLGRDAYPRVSFAAVPAPGGPEVLLDVRRADEHADGHVAGAVHIPLDQVADRIDEVPPGRVWVHCAAGYRAGIAASLLHRAGRDVVLVDDAFANAAPAGLVMSR